MVKVMHKTSKVFILFCLAFLAVLGIGNVASAADTYDTEIESRVLSSLQMVVPDAIEMSVNPTTQPFDIYETAILVGTNNHTGYYMTMYSDDTTLYKTTDATKTIKPLTAKNGGYTEDDFEVNKWGYKINDGNYFPVVSGTELMSSDTNTYYYQRASITFATKVNYTQASGVYETSINFVAVANPLPTYIQHMDSYYCTTDPMTVVDTRDEQLYTVQRLADGNCWMMDNLNLGNVPLTADLTSRNTNIIDPVSADTFNSWLKTTQSSDVYTSQTQPELGLVDGVDSISGAAYGTLYNFCAASAGTYCYEPNEEAPVKDALQDLCPAGWRLPTGGDYGEFDKLINGSGYQNSYLSPLSEGGLNYARSGTDFGGGSNTGYNGYLWSSSRHDEWAMETIMFSTAFGIDPVSYNGRYVSAGIRCVLGNDRPARVPEYLQDMDINMANSLRQYYEYSIKDKRDNELYYIRRFDEDGNIWLLQNLRLDPTAVALEDLKGNTNASDGTLTYLKDGGGSGRYPSTGVTANNPLSNSSSSPCYQGYNPCVMNTYKDTEVTRLGSSYSKEKAGIYYNYCAAFAGSYCGYSGDYGSPNEDICPKNWRIPSYSEWQTAFTKINQATWDLRIANAGYYYNSSKNSTNYFWSSTKSSSSYISFSSPYFSSNSMGSNYNGNAYGQVIRCIFKKD